jgi:hypothetical protein
VTALLARRDERSQHDEPRDDPEYLMADGSGPRDPQ